MKSLQESLFDDKLIEKDIFDNPAFKQWINRPNVLWYIYYYWESGMEDMLEDFMTEEWEEYKPLVETLLEIWDDATRKVFGPHGWSWFWIDLEQYYNDREIADKFDDEGDFNDDMMDAMQDIHHKSTQEDDGIWKTWFRGGLPKNSDCTYLLNKLGIPMAKPGKLDGGICLTNDDSIIVLGFPKGINKDILKLFNIK